MPLIIWATGCEGGRIVCRPLRVSGPFQIVTSKHALPPEWLERAIPLNLDDQENAPCR